MPHDQDSFADARQMATKIARDIALALKLRDDEVSVLLSNADGTVLRFLYPEALFKTGVKLAMDRNSLAGQAIYYRKAQLHNDMQQVKRMAFFERVKTGEAAPLPIQKMLTVPIIEGERVLGVVQCSRKAKTLAEAGADFTKADIALLEDQLSELAMMMPLLSPEDF